MLLAAAALAWTVAAPPALGHPESAAPSLRPDVVAAWHGPLVVQPHTQWQGFLRLAADSNVTAAAYQVCRVGQTCFAPPTPARTDGQGLWSFDTMDYTVGGRPVDYQAGWWLGVKWWLNETRSDGTQHLVGFPTGPDPLSAACMGDQALACAEAHYLAFDVARPAKDAALGTWVIFAAVSVAAVLADARARRPR